MHLIVEDCRGLSEVVVSEIDATWSIRNRTNGNWWESNVNKCECNPFNRIECTCVYVRRRVCSILFSCEWLICFFSRETTANTTCGKHCCLPTYAATDCVACTVVQWDFQRKTFSPTETVQAVRGFRVDRHAALFHGNAHFPRTGPPKATFKRFHLAFYFEHNRDLVLMNFHVFKSFFFI